MPSSPGPSRPPRRRRRTVREWIGWLIVAGFAAAVVAFVAGYVSTSIPTPSSVSTAQTSVITYAGGRHEIGRIGSVNRIDVPLSRVPLAVQHAVLAAEDRDYYDEPGVSIRGISRALVANVRGGGISQGGSTITQQYAKNAFLTQRRTFSRKLREMFIAIKLDRTTSKDTVLEDYLNTIYFGRGAYGISTAAQAYFHTPVQNLDAAQGAVLAAAVRAPSIYDPAVNRAASVARWRYVIRGMRSVGWLSRSAKVSYPKVAAPRQEDTLGGTDGYLVEAVRKELDTLGYTDAKLAAGGYRVVTTFNRRLQRDAVRAERSVLGSVKGPVSALTAINPKTGSVVALYGGKDYTGKQKAAQLNLATNDRPAGSSFKPYTLATALSRGIALDTYFAGYSPMVVKGWGSPGHVVRNDSNEQCSYCDLTQATAESINTIFAQLVVKVGPSRVASTAHDAGVQAVLGDDGYVAPSITLGVYGVSTTDQAAGYATFANHGVHAATHMVAKILDTDGNAVYTAQGASDRAFPAGVAADATYAMTKVVQYGTGTQAQLDDGRPAAGKTGTTSNNTDAWFCGFTPQLSAAVWLGNLDDSPLTNVAGYPGGVYGGQLPAQVWKAFMDRALAGSKVEQFPDRADVGTDDQGSSPTPSPSPTTPSPSATTASPSPTPTATPTTPAPTTPAPTTPAPTTPAPSPTTPTPQTIATSGAASPAALRRAGR